MGLTHTPRKNILTPRKESPGLGLKVKKKKKKLHQEASKLLHVETFYSLREASRLLGKLNAVSQAVPPDVATLLQNVAERPGKNTGNEQQIL